jgi:hypothetical protein
MFTASSQAVSIYTGSVAAIGVGSNPDTDGRANYWKSGTTTFNIKNRLGDSRRFNVFVLGGLH